MLAENFWSDIFKHPETKMALWIMILAMALLIGVFLVKQIRDWAVGEPEDETSDHLSTFREMRDQGMLDEEEYQKLKAKLGTNLLSEVGTTKTSSKLNANEKIIFEEEIDPANPERRE